MRTVKKKLKVCSNGHTFYKTSDCPTCHMMDKHVLFDNTLIELKRQIEQEAEQKMEHGGVDTRLVKQRVTGRTNH